MTDKIVYLITSSGMDGMEPTSIVYAHSNEEIRDEVYNKSKNKNWFTRSKRIVEVEREKKQALTKLDGLQRYLLDLPLEHPPTMDNHFTVQYWNSDLERITGLRNGQIISQYDINRLINARKVNIMIDNPPSTDGLQICWIDNKRFQQR